MVAVFQKLPSELRMKYHYHWLLPLIAWLLPLLTQAQIQQGDSVSRLALIQNTGILRVGVPGDYAPFAIIKGDSLSGADITMARALAAALRVKAVFIKTSWPNLSADMKADKFDIAVGGISITPDRAAIGRFSTPYYSGGKTFLCRRADSARFSTAAAVNQPGVRLIVNKGGTNESVARSMFPLADLIVYPDNIGVFNEIIAGRANVMLTDDSEADLKTLQYPQLCRSFAGTVTKSDKAIWIQKDDALVALINAWLQKQLDSGAVHGWMKAATAAGGLK